MPFPRLFPTEPGWTVLAEDMDGRLYHMEIEGSDTVDHAEEQDFTVP